MKKIPLLLFAIPTAVIGWMLLYGNMRIGQAINAYMPCTQNPADSFPCFGVYEMWIMAALACISLIGLIQLVISLRKKD